VNSVQVPTIPIKVDEKPENQWSLYIVYRNWEMPLDSFLKVKGCGVVCQAGLCR